MNSEYTSAIIGSHIRGQEGERNSLITYSYVGIAIKDRPYFITDDVTYRYMG
jgi:hypothetical protein